MTGVAVGIVVACTAGIAAELLREEGYTPMTTAERGNVQGIIDRVDKIGEKVGSWDLKTDARQTGASVHAKFANRVDVFDALEWVEILNQCPQKLTSACERLLRADAEIARLQLRSVNDHLEEPEAAGELTQ